MIEYKQIGLPCNVAEKIDENIQSDEGSVVAGGITDGCEDSLGWHVVAGS
jgi:hypothetical protein